MTLEKAIKESQKALDKQFHLLTPTAIVAIRLGIEAIKAVQQSRRGISSYECGIGYLPGETKEEK